MQQYDVCESEWPSFFENFNKRHRGETVRIEVYDPVHTIIDPSDPTPALRGSLRLEEIRVDAPCHQIAIHGANPEEASTRVVDMPCRLILHRDRDEDDTLEIHSMEGLRTCVRVDHGNEGVTKHLAATE